MISPFPWPRPGPSDLPEQYLGLARTGPLRRAVLASGQEVVLIAGHRRFRQFLHHPQVSSEHSHPAYPHIFPVARRRIDGSQRPKLGYSGLDRPDHSIHRRTAAHLFSEPGLARLQPDLDRIAERCIDTLIAQGPGSDLVELVAEPMPAEAIATLLGLPAEVRPELMACSRALMRRDTAPHDLARASSRLRELVAGELARQEHGPSDSLLGRMVRRYLEQGQYDREQLVELAGSVIVAGHETTTNMIALSVLVLVRHPGQLDLVRADPDRWPAAVEELLRLLSIADLTTIRVTTADLHVDGELIPAGTGVIALGASANHDPSVFARPAELDVGRDTRSHVAFGSGPHRCLGRHLARMELVTVLRLLFDRLPRLGLADPEHEPAVSNGSAIHGIERLPVTW